MRRPVRPERVTADAIRRYKEHQSNLPVELGMDEFGPASILGFGRDEDELEQVWVFSPERR